ncbi:MAG TPA: hypothetical protein IGS53_05660 [Leptolyngbyaceae cyanobacterium M33_DOE_097]|uniref:Uncharacterized protein n=1 Tax=Oscillatoriales cyanobacterium SpSt-418 TaxID=2282169 RepID=A0A7C3KCV9_9CYAN|nr:hypothetical protein [Leptolyngbyaceae cyanobacterium M33_DOE_097]
MRHLLLATTLSAGAVSLIAPLINQGFGASRSDQPVVRQLSATVQSPTSRNALADAEALAWEAAVLVQNPPHPVATWRNARLHWKEAIELLEAIPADSELADQAKQKLAVYRANYAEISDRLKREKKATQNFKFAQRNAWNAAVLVQDPPHPLGVWQSAESQWQTAIDRLEAIPQTTTLAAKAQQSLKTYRANYQEIQQRVKTEETASASLQEFFTKANLLAQSAEAPISVAGRADVGISYEQYEKLVQGLDQQLKDFARHPHAKSHPLYNSLTQTMTDHETALRLWKTYLQYKQIHAAWLYDDLYDQHLPTELVPPSDIKKYSLKTSLDGTRLSLRVSLAQIWSDMRDRLLLTRKQQQDFAAQRQAPSESGKL